MNTISKITHSCKQYSPDVTIKTGNGGMMTVPVGAGVERMLGGAPCVARKSGGLPALRTYCTITVPIMYGWIIQ
jgi:hypothetical protein